MRIEPHASLTPYHTFAVAAHVRWLVHIEQDDELWPALNDPRWTGLPRLILGGGSNLLPTGDFAGVVFRLCTQGKQCVAEDAASLWVEAAAGETWHPFVQWTLSQGGYGLENLSLIPGTVGAAPIQNIGAYGVELKDCFEQLTLLDARDGSLHTLNREQCAFGYRDSVFKHAWREHGIVLRVRFRLNKTATVHTGYGELQKELDAMQVSAPTPLDVAQAVIRVRQRKLPDPAVIGNAGSFFKNPLVPAAQAAALLAQYPNLVHYPATAGQVKLAAGWLIDQCGWKGRQQGAAGVYERQALVLVNHGGASGGEVLALAQAIQRDVMQRFGIALEPEPIIL
ncbi:UDP-N-acetylmuramate dehydrogenase [Leeia aquatica]|uniref:UDP-N-acetylenolpyruvoylglucosamine reductase n=1 Tax=Leeia aquatica TaxID=2725557 RepID=A0A847RZ30_9NEIS|nr:UDP-N-acetylmuramate dehydrogenase [Leeia aquatica]NLR76390.1 UDP-N-acetylmuramate dehydrogenase [Leeia aquatica]